MEPFHDDPLTMAEYAIYKKAWRYLRGCEIAFWVVCLSIFIGFGWHKAYDLSRREHLILMSLMGSGGIFVILGLRFRCPRCGMSFFYKGGFKGPDGTAMHKLSLTKGLLGKL